MTLLHRFEHSFLLIASLMTLCVAAVVLRMVFWYVRQPQMIETLTHNL